MSLLVALFTACSGSGSSLLESRAGRIDRPATGTGLFEELPSGFQRHFESQAAWGDFNNDGFLDLLVTGYVYPDFNWTTVLYKNKGDGTFQELTEAITNLPGKGDVQASWIDYDRDGYLDLALHGKSCPWFLDLFHNEGGSGSFQKAPFAFPLSTSHAWGDYDNDGYPDLVLRPEIASDRVRLFRNDAGFGFTETTPATFPAVGVGTFPTFVDYNNDGREDLLFLFGTSGPPLFYRNEGSGQFTPVSILIENSAVQHPLLGGKIAWGDFNNDGRADLLHVGADAPDIYRNDGPGAQPNTWKMTRMNALGFPAGSAMYGFGNTRYSATWGDYDNDGYLDVLIEGVFSNLPTQYASRVYHNDGPTHQFQFSISDELHPMSMGQASWGDYNNDGYLDIALTGTDYVLPEFAYTKLYRNTLGVNSFVPNTPPSSPTGLGAVVNGGEVQLSWNSSSDSQTPTAGLSYDIFIGSSPSLVDKVSPFARISDGKRTDAAFGAAGHTTSRTIRDLPAGLYTWGVQAVDTAFAGSPFSTGTFVIAPPPPTLLNISGHITGRENDLPLEGVTLSAFNATSELESVVTDKEGFYIFKKVPFNWSGTIAPFKKGYAFQSLVPGSLGHNSIHYKPLQEDQKAQDYRMKPAL